MKLTVYGNKDSLFGTGQYQNLKRDLFKLTDEAPGFINAIPTAEVPVTNLLRDFQIVDEKPSIKYCPLCIALFFRPKRAATGTRYPGMIRQHQFEKVELVQFVKPEDSAALETLIPRRSYFAKLGLAYRMVILCTGDMGFLRQNLRY